MRNFTRSTVTINAVVVRSKPNTDKKCFNLVQPLVQVFSLVATVSESVCIYGDLQWLN